jgi:hypothetical protein
MDERKLTGEMFARICYAISWFGLFWAGLLWWVTR